jgi:precorrin-6B methylase 1
MRLKELKSVSGFFNLETADIYLISGGLDVNMTWLEKLSAEDEEIMNSCLDHVRKYLIEGE